MPRMRQGPTLDRNRVPVGAARRTHQAARICPPQCRCGARLRGAVPARCPLPMDPLGPLAGASARALADLGLSPGEIARYAAVAETRVRAALREPGVDRR